MKERVPDPDRMKKIKGPKISREELKGAKVRVTTYLDADVVEALKQTASGSGGKYQTLLNQILRSSLIGDTPSILERLAKLESEVYKKKRAA